MALDVLITPAGGLVDFRDNGVSVGSMRYDGADLLLSALTGKTRLGNTDSDVYLGTGTGGTDLWMEQDGRIAAVSARTLTLGKVDSALRVASKELRFTYTPSTTELSGGIGLWTNADADLNALAPGNGTVIWGPTAGHVAVALDSDDDADAFWVTAHSGSAAGPRRTQDRTLLKLPRTGILTLPQYAAGVAVFGAGGVLGTSASLGVAQGGTGTTSITANRMLRYNGTAFVASSYDEGDFARIAATQTISGAWTFSGVAALNGGITLGGASSNLISFNANGANAPTFTSRSAGAKVVLLGAIAASSADYALGMESSAMWIGMPTTSGLLKFYGGTTNIASLTGTGNLTVSGSLNSVTLALSAATGTAPMTVASTTVVANLNADLLDGQQGSYYQAWGNITGKPTTLSGYGITDAVSLGSGGTITAASITISNANPGYILNETDATADNRMWSTRLVGSEYRIQAFSDASVGGTDLLSIQRSGNNATSLKFGDQSSPVLLADEAADEVRVKGNLVWHAGNGGAGTGLHADLLDGQHGAYYLDPANLSAAVSIAKGGTNATSFTANQIVLFNGTRLASSGLLLANIAPYETLSFTPGTMTAGWYRVATSGPGISTVSGRFKINWQTATGSQGGAIVLEASCFFGRTDGTALHQLHYTDSTGTTGFSKARVVYHTTAAGNFAYLELYYNSTTALGVCTTSLLDRTAWALNASLTAGSIPSGYTSKELSFNAGLVIGGTVSADQFISNAGQGTAPFIVGSTTLVSNLNADLLDGQHGTYYLDPANMSGAVPINLGGTGRTSAPAANKFLYYDGTKIEASAFTDTDFLKSTGTQSIDAVWTFSATTVFSNTGDSINATGAINAYYFTGGQVTLTSNGIEVGRAGRASAGTPFIDFHSSANSPDYDSRIIASGGNATSGSGSLTVTANGGVTFSGAITAPRITLSQAVGTAPMTVTSTTVVTNLNADLLDGQHGSYYIDPLNLSASVPVSKGGTGRVDNPASNRFLWFDGAQITSSGYDASSFVVPSADVLVTGAWTYNNHIYLNNATSTWIRWGTNGSAFPSFTTRSAGTKLVLRDTLGSTAVDYALGVGSNSLWYSVPAVSTSNSFRWYAGTTEVARLTTGAVPELNVAKFTGRIIELSAGTDETPITITNLVSPVSPQNGNVIYGTSTIQSGTQVADVTASGIYVLSTVGQTNAGKGVYDLTVYGAQFRVHGVAASQRASTVYGVYSRNVNSGTSPASSLDVQWGTSFGGYFKTNLNGAAGNILDSYGVAGEADVTAAGGTITNQMSGVYGTAYNRAAGTVPLAYAGRFEVGTLVNSATITDARGVDAAVTNTGTGSSIGTAYGVRSTISNAAGLTVPTGYLLYGAYAGANPAGVTAAWGLYVTGEKRNYLSNALYIANAGYAGSAKLHVTGAVDFTSTLALGGLATLSGGLTVTGAVSLPTQSLNNSVLATSGVTANTYRSVTVNDRGIVTAGSNPTTLSGYGITDAQPLDAALSAIAAAGSTANRIVYYTGTGAAALTTITSYARSLLADSTSADARSHLELGTVATESIVPVSKGGTGLGAGFTNGSFLAFDGTNISSTGASIATFAKKAEYNGGTGSTGVYRYRDVLAVMVANGTGTLKITMPNGWSNTMLDFRITLRETSTAGGYARATTDILAAGFSSSAANAVWQGTRALAVGFQHQVRFAFDGTKTCLLIGDMTTSWASLRVIVTDVFATAAGALSSTWDTGWSAAVLADETGLTSIVTPPMNAGLNSDTLDNLDSTQFVRADTSTVITGDSVLYIQPSSSFDPGEVNSSALGGLALRNTGTYTLNGYGGGLYFTAPNSSSRRRAGIAIKYTGTNDQQAGLAFFTKSSTSTATHVIAERMVLDHMGVLTIAGNLVWHAGNDGTGSTLDADLLDGQEGSWYRDWANTTNKPTTLSGYGITDAQVSNVNLSALAGLTGAADRLPYFTAAGTMGLAVFTSTARALLDDTSSGAMRTTLGVAIGSNVQAWNAGLDSLAALSGAGVVTATASNSFVMRAIGVAGAGDIPDRTAADGRYPQKAGTETIDGNWTFTTGPNSAGPMIFTQAGLGAPSFTTRSSGTRLVLRDILDGDSSGYGLGVESNYLWFSASELASARGFKWYGGVTEIMQLSGSTYSPVPNAVSLLNVTGDLNIAGFAAFGTAATNSNVMLRGGFVFPTSSTSGNRYGLLLDMGWTLPTLTNNATLRGIHVNMDDVQTTVASSGSYGQDIVGGFFGVAPSNVSNQAYNVVKGVDTLLANTATSGSGNNVWTQAFGGAFEVRAQGSTANLPTAYGVSARVRSSGTGTLGAAVGVYGHIQHLASTQVGSAYAGQFVAEHSGTGTVTAMRGVQGRVLVGSSGTLTQARGVESNIEVYMSSGSIPTAYLYYGDYTDGSSKIATKWGLYIGTEDKNYLSNALHIANSTYSGTAKLHVTGAVDVAGAITSSDTITSSAGAGTNNILLNGATSNWIMWNTNGLNAPSFTTRSTGTKIVLRDTLTASAVDFALGIGAGQLWISVPNSSNAVRFYAGTTNTVTITGSGALQSISTVQGTQFISTVTSGTAPMTVVSTTVVANLNADLLDGYDASDFPRKTETATVSGAWTFSNAVTMTGTATLDTHLVPKSYVDGRPMKDSVRVATTAALTVTATASVLTNGGVKAAIAIDGVTLSVGNRVLVKNQANAAQNGIYTVTTLGSSTVNWVLTRAADADVYTDYASAVVGVDEGSTLANTSWYCTSNSTGTLGSSNIVFQLRGSTTLTNFLSAPTAVGDLPYVSALGDPSAIVWSTTTLSAFGRALIDDVDQAAARTTLGLAAVAASGSATDLTAGTLDDARLPQSMTEKYFISQNGLRLAPSDGANVGYMFRRDSSNFYLLLTNSGDAFGNFNSLRPFTVNGTTGAVGFATAVTVNQTITLTASAGTDNIYFGASGSNWIRWNNVGVNPPAFTTRSTGTKMILWNALASNQTDMAIGVYATGMWFGVRTTDGFQWYSGTTNTMALASTGTLTITSAGTADSILLNGTTSNWIRWGSAGAAAPAFTTRSAGTKLILADTISGTSVDYGFGIEGSFLWSSVGDTSRGFKWYAGTTNVLTVAGTGTMTINASVSEALYLSNASSNWIRWNPAGAQAPTLTTRSSGTKLLLSDTLSSSQVDYAIGIAGGVLWNSVPSSTRDFRWYAGTTVVATLEGAGNLTIAGNITTTATVTGGTVTATGAMNGASVVATGAVSGATVTATGLITAGTLSTGAVSGSGTITITTGALVDNIYLSGATSNWIRWSQSGLNPPSLTTRSTGTKLVLYDLVGATTVDHAIGIEEFALWMSVPSDTRSFKWYAGTSNIMTLDGKGNLAVTGDISVVGNASIYYPVSNDGNQIQEYYAEFLSANTPWGGFWLDQNSNGALSIDAGFAPYTGAATFSTGTNAAGRRHATSSTAMFRANANNAFKMKIRATLDTNAPSATEDYVAQMGFANSTTGLPTYAATFLYYYDSTAGAAKLSCYSRNNGTAMETVIATVPTGYNTYEVVSNGTSAIKFYINGVEVASHTTIPSNGAAVSAVGVRKVAGTTARTIIVDWIALQVKFTGRPA